jgi:hypothetical protein
MHTYQLRIVGTAHEGRDSVVRRYCKRGDTVKFHREPENLFDPNAIAVWHVRLNKAGRDIGDQVGYVPADIARELAPLLDRAEAVIVSAVIDMVFADPDMDSPRLGVLCRLRGRPITQLDDLEPLKEGDVADEEPPLEWRSVRGAAANEPRMAEAAARVEKPEARASVEVPDKDASKQGKLL